MGKSFRTVEELVKILESRNIETDANTHAAIDRESYYAIVNGYKEPFLDKHAMTRSSDDVYLQGTKFQWIYNLFLFDRELRFITFKYLTNAEAVMRTAVAYAFCHNHPEDNSYLDRSNFCASGDYLVPRAFSGNKRQLHSSNLNDLMNRLNDKLVIRRTTRDFVKHYIRVHGTVPLWVLANDLTFGNVVHFYQLMQVKDRREVCRIIAGVSERDVANRGHLTERELLRAATVLNDFRNLCAHDERLYCAKFDNDDFSAMTALMTTLLPEREVHQFIEEMMILFARYSNRLHRVNPYTLLKDMGFAVKLPKLDNVARRGAMPPKPGEKPSARRASGALRHLMRSRMKGGPKKRQ